MSKDESWEDLQRSLGLEPTPKSRMTVDKVYQSMGAWWVRSGTNSQEVTSEDAVLVADALVAAGKPVTIAYVMVGVYPYNRLGEVEVIS